MEPTWSLGKYEQLWWMMEGKVRCETEWSGKWSNRSGFAGLTEQILHGKEESQRCNGFLRQWDVVRVVANGVSLSFIFHHILSVEGSSWLRMYKIEIFDRTFICFEMLKKDVAYRLRLHCCARQSGIFDKTLKIWWSVRYLVRSYSFALEIVLLLSQLRYDQRKCQNWIISCMKSTGGTYFVVATNDYMMSIRWLSRLF